MTKHWVILSVLALVFINCTKNAFAQTDMHPETMMVTLHVKPGSEAEMQQVLEQHWKTATSMKLVNNVFHLTLRGTEDGNKPYFVDVFTWLDASIPDDAPPEIQKLWEQMNRLVESRDGHAGLEFVPVTVVSH